MENITSEKLQATEEKAQHLTDKYIKLITLFQDETVDIFIATVAKAITDISETTGVDSTMIVHEIERASIQMEILKDTIKGTLDV